MNNRILCPTDFSETSLVALRYAENLAKKIQGTIVLAHACRLPSSWDREGQNHPFDPNEEKKMAELPCEVPCERVFHAGPPGPVICWLAQEHDCDLIVMGTHGRTGIQHLLLGSTAEYVVKHARRPVLTVPECPADKPRLEEPIVMPIPGPGA